MNLKKIFGLALVGLMLIPLAAQEPQIRFSFPRYQVELYPSYTDFDSYHMIILANELEFNSETGRLICKGEDACLFSVMNKVEATKPLPIKNIDIVSNWPFIRISEREKDTTKWVLYKYSAETDKYEIIEKAVKTKDS